MGEKPPLPPGQYESTTFPRFGLPRYAFRYPSDVDRVEIAVGGDVEEKVSFSEALHELPRLDQVSDFHCVTTWSRRALTWGGFRFVDFYESLVVPKARPATETTFVVLKSQDGYRTSLPLEDLLADDVMLADTLDGEPLSIAHGAPLRLVAPAHYAYKSPKHINRIEFWNDDSKFRPAGLRFMAHPRARVALEERANGAPGWVFRYLYRPLVRPTIARFRRAMAAYYEKEGRKG
jgi:DMSO/TMAO reductase YedYZ molybdopterin-dependent catalytic subunit